MCEDRAAVVLGGDGRWHRREECDDGNAADGDGCASRAGAARIVCVCLPVCGCVRLCLCMRARACRRTYVSAM